MKLVTLNLWGLAPLLDARLALAARGLRALEPDVIALQEVRPLPGASGRTTAHALAEQLDMLVVYAPARGDGAGEEGLAILSRFPLGAHRITRLPYPRVDEPSILLSVPVRAPAATLWCHTTHLAWRLDDGVTRERQVLAIDEHLRGCDADAPQLLCGDFNAEPGWDEVRFLRGETSLAGRRAYYQDAWRRIHGEATGATWCMQRGEARGQRSVDVDRRLDYVFVTPRRKDGRGTVLDCRRVLEQPDEHGVVASDHCGVLADVRIA